MLQLSQDYLENPSGWREKISGPETWWANRQEALEHAGYMLRPRYRPGWRPSWVTTGKDYFNTEDGQTHSVGVDTFTPGTCSRTFSCACAWTQPGSLTEDL